MIVPGTQAARQEQDENPILSGLDRTHMMMAAAVDYTKRAAADPDIQKMYHEFLPKLVDPEKFDEAVKTMPKSKNIEDRRLEDAPNQLDQLMEESYEGLEHYGRPIGSVMGKR